ncbi:MAG: UbiX family flavin prenyltransferase [Acidobacteria bacterium]|nr:UbiX family flavin prenyltransferase [Acidobacteriota bacterium]
MPFAAGLIGVLSRHPEVERTHLVISQYGLQTIQEEMEVSGGKSGCVRALAGPEPGNVVVHAATEMAAPIASGSYRTDGMVVIPCSAGTLGAIASGAGTHLVHRAAEVCLKEGRPLILAFRETPLHAGHLENLLRAVRAGARVFPICPAFYHRPKTIQDLIDQFNARILDHLGLSHRLGTRWRDPGQDR